jgi:hypothetical protein
MKCFIHVVFTFVVVILQYFVQANSTNWSLTKEDTFPLVYNFQNSTLTLNLQYIDFYSNQDFSLIGRTLQRYDRTFQSYILVIRSLNPSGLVKWAKFIQVK